MNNTRPDKDKVSHIFSSKRLALMLLALLTFLFVASLSWNIINQRNAALESARIRAKTVLEKDILFRRWNAMLGGVYAPVSNKTQPNPYLEGVVTERDLKTPSGRELTLVNPEFMTRQVFELEEKGNGVLGHITSLKPIRAENTADPWEREALLAFEKGTGEISSLKMINGREYMRLMRPLITEEGCLKCHERQGYREGDIRGGISVSVPMEPHWAALGRSLNALLFWHIFLWLCGVGAIYAGYRLQRRAEEEQKEAKEELRVLFSRQEAILTAVPDIIMEVDINKVYTWANQAGKEFFGEDVIGKEAAFYFEGEQDTYNVVQPLFYGYEDIIYIESWQRRKDGQKRLLAWRCRVLKDEQGSTTGVLSSALDITERRESESRLRESEKKFRDMAEGSLVGVYLIQDGIFRYCNNKLAAIFGYTSEEIIDKKGPEDLVYPEDWHIVKENLRRRIEGEIDSVHYSFRGITKDRKTIYVDVYGAKTDYQGRPAVLGTLLDITEHVLAEEQLRHSQKMEAIGTLTGGIAHDFNNILNVIIGYSNMVRDTLKTDSLSREHMNEVLTAAERAANLTKKLLAFSRKQIGELKPININETIVNFQKMLVRLIRENIDLHLDLEDSPLIVMADAGHIEQVLMNLASNARHAMPEGGRLTISTGIQEIDDEYIAVNGYGAPGMYAFITVADTGAGIDAETQEKIFEPFFTTKNIGEGTGLGLSISYGIIKQHNGYINVCSGPGEGTVFKIYLPLIDETAYLEKKVETPDALKGGHETILLAEDDASLRDLARIVLESFGYSIITAEDGEDAIMKFMENRDKIQLVILDMIMPKKSGKEVSEVIRGKDPQIKILFTSGYTMDTIKIEEITESGFEFILKPFLPKDLLKKVREILDGEDKPSSRDSAIYTAL